MDLVYAMLQLCFFPKRDHVINVFEKKGRYQLLCILEAGCLLQMCMLMRESD